MLREGFRLLKKNLSHVIIFEIIYRIISIAIMLPLFYLILNTSIKAAGIPYLTKGTMKRYFATPTTYLFFALIVLVFAIYMVINIS